MPEFVVERKERPKPLLSLPRGKQRDEMGLPTPPVVEMWVELAKGTAGCAVCDRPIPKGTSRVKLNVRLAEPRTLENGQRQLHQAYYLHPGCMTERVKPEVVRHGLDCYDCGKMPEENELGLDVRFTNRCFTVSKFSPAPICETCTGKPTWMQCEICSIHYPPWMVSQVVGADDSSEMWDGEWVTLEVREQLQAVKAACEFCAKRFKLVTQTEADKAAEDFERLRREIAEHGFYEAGADEQ